MSNNLTDKSGDQFEEIFSRLVVEGLGHAFAISKEENHDGVWHYRIYNYAEDLNKTIEEYLFDRIRQLMMKAEFCLNMNEDLAARTHLQKLLYIWKEQWDASGRN